MFRCFPVATAPRELNWRPLSASQVEVSWRPPLLALHPLPTHYRLTFSSDNRSWRESTVPYNTTRTVVCVSFIITLNYITALLLISSGSMPTFSPIPKPMPSILSLSILIFYYILLSAMHIFYYMSSLCDKFYLKLYLPWRPQYFFQYVFRNMKDTIFHIP